MNSFDRGVTMPALVKVRLVLLVLVAALAAALAAGCGAGGGDAGEAGEAAAVAPADAPLFADFVVRPEGEVKANIDALAKRIAGVDDLGGLIVEKLEESAAEDGSSFDYGKEVEPWLGERGGAFAEEYADGDFTGYGVAVQVEDEGAAWGFVEKKSEEEDEPAKDGSYEGVDFKVAADDGQTVGVFDGLLAFAESEAVFKDMVDASEGESLADSEKFKSAAASFADEGAADLFVDTGAIIESSGEVDPQMKAFLEGFGLKPDEMTAAASVIPGSEDIEVDYSADAAEGEEPAGDGSKILASLPGTSVAALGAADFGKRLQKAVDRLDELGIPGEVPPHQIKQGLKQSGFDFEGFTDSLGDVGIFLTGNSKRTLGGAVVMETTEPNQAKNTVSNLGLLLRASNTPGVTALHGRFSGFSIRSEELGPQPLVVAAAGDRMTIAYGLRAATAALTGSDETLAANPAYEEAVGALGDTPVSGFVDGQAALRLASALVPPTDEGFREAKRYLSKVRYVAIGSESSGGRNTTKLILGVGK